MQLLKYIILPFPYFFLSCLFLSCSTFNSNHPKNGKVQALKVKGVLDKNVLKKEVFRNSLSQICFNASGRGRLSIDTRKNLFSFESVFKESKQKSTWLLALDVPLHEQVLLSFPNNLKSTTGYLGKDFQSLLEDFFKIYEIYKNPSWPLTWPKFLDGEWELEGKSFELKMKTSRAFLTMLATNLEGDFYKKVVFTWGEVGKSGQVMSGNLRNRLILFIDSCR